MLGNYCNFTGKDRFRPATAALECVLLITQRNMRASRSCRCRVAVFWFCSIYVCVCVFVFVFAHAPFARVVVREGPEAPRPPRGCSQHARAARAAEATQATSLSTWWSSLEAAWGGGRPRLHSSQQQALCWNIDVTGTHAVLPGVAHSSDMCGTLSRFIVLALPLLPRCS